MDKIQSFLKDKSLLVIFAYAPTGLGHLRVTDALYHGLPKEVNGPLLLSSQDTTVTFLHRLMSIHVLLRRLFEWGERGIMEEITTRLYRSFLRSHTEILYKQMITIVSERFTNPTRVLVIATHFGLAHQFATIKEKLEKEKNIKMTLVVQVTDDCPHHIWYVAGADMIVVPSEKTKQKLMSYGEKTGLPPVHFVVNAYPLSPLLTKDISTEQAERRLNQIAINTHTTTHIMIPISGAAVGTQFFTEMIDTLHLLSHKFLFHVVSKNAVYTKRFIDQMAKRSYVKLSIAGEDRQVVSLYEDVYNRELISLEVTKPSEQCFKALLDCGKKSASLLLLTEPIGRQEQDNLDFLRRHMLIPSKEEEEKLWQYAAGLKNISPSEKETLLAKATQWRGISLPIHAKEAAHFIDWCMKEGIFTQMMNCKLKPNPQDSNNREINSRGVETFWDLVGGLL